MIEFWMKNHLVSDITCNSVNLQSPKNIQEMTNNIVLESSVGDTILQFIFSIEQHN